MIKIFLLLNILILALILRFYQLGSNPISLDWDEVSLGYNAYSLLKTSRDEYGNYLPLSIRSFNDFKPPLYTYATILSVAVFGLNEYSVRLISAIAGILAVIAVYYLSQELFGKRGKLAQLCAFFLAVSPWHLQFSRIAFEANVALTLFIFGTLFFLKGLVKNFYFNLSALFFALSIYAYHSPRLIVPVFIVGLSLIYLPQIKIKLASYFLFLLIIGIFFLPLIKQIGQSTGARFSSVSSINPDEKLGPSIKAIEYDLKRRDHLGKILHNRRIIFGREILAGYLDHFNFDFLFLSGDPPGRHHAVDQGVLYYFDLPFVVMGIIYLIKRLKLTSYQTIFLWFLVAPLASSLTSGTPHAVRAIFYLPTYQIFTSLGLLSALNYLKSQILSYKKNLLLFFVFCLPAIASATAGFLFLVNFFYYLHQYYIHSPKEYARWWQFGYKEVVETANKYKPYVNKIITTYHYDQPYIYFLFYNKTDPAEYQKLWQGDFEISRAERKFAQYEFRNIDWENDKHLTGVLLIGTPSEIPDNAPGIVNEIRYPDDTIAFRIVFR